MITINAYSQVTPTENKINEKRNVQCTWYLFKFEQRDSFVYTAHNILILSFILTL